MINNRPLFLLLVSFALSACTQPAEDPKTIADKYWQYIQTGNASEAEKLATTNSRRIFNEHTTRIHNDTQIDNNDTKTIVTTTITTIDPENNTRHSETFETVLVLENGRWKVDISQSPIPPEATSKQEEMEKLAEELSDSMQENIESIDEAMDQGMEMLNEALQEGSKEMSQSLLHLMNELNTTMQESIDKMKQRRQQQLQQENSQQHNRPTQPDPRQGEGMI